MKSEKIEIYFSKTAKYIQLLMLLIFTFGLIIFIIETKYFFASLSIIGIYLFGKGFYNSLDTQPQIIISKNYIQFVNSTPLEWHMISNLEIKPSGRAGIYLYYKTDEKKSRIQLNLLNKDPYYIFKLIQRYKAESQN